MLNLSLIKKIFSTPLSVGIIFDKDCSFEFKKNKYRNSKYCFEFKIVNGSVQIEVFSYIKKNTQWFKNDKLQFFYNDIVKRKIVFDEKVLDSFLSYHLSLWENDRNSFLLHRFELDEAQCLLHVFEDDDGNRKWAKNGLYDRCCDLPAIEYCDGSKQWFLNGKLHREFAPAIKYWNGEEHWYKNGVLHRIDGPAIVLANGQKKWYLNGKELSCQEHPFEQSFIEKQLLSSIINENNLSTSSKQEGFNNGKNAL